MTTLHRLESATSDPCAGGILVTFPSGSRKTLAWRCSAGDAIDHLGMAKELAARALDACMREGRADDAERTNWASFVAGAQRMVRDWDQARGASGSLQ